LALACISDNLARPSRVQKCITGSRAKKVIEYSIEEARNLNHNYVGTEHLLLGLLREKEGVAAQVLMNLGVSAARAREEVLRLLSSTDSQQGCDPTAIVATAHTLPTEAKDHPLSIHLLRTIQEFEYQKEWCVAKQQFEEAASLRDMCESLRKSLNQLIELLKQNPKLGETEQSS
jgi:ATP-dependent Clp protease ATP-binding subunit ClpA